MAQLHILSTASPGRLIFPNIHTHTYKPYIHFVFHKHAKLKACQSISVVVARTHRAFYMHACCCSAYSQRQCPIQGSVWDLYVCVCAENIILAKFRGTLFDLSPPYYRFHTRPAPFCSWYIRTPEYSFTKLAAKEPWRG